MTSTKTSRIGDGAIKIAIAVCVVISAILLTNIVLHHISALSDTTGTSSQ